MQVHLPRLGTWCELLPSPWDQDPYVVVVLSPLDAKACTVRQKGGGYSLGCLEFASGRIRGIQVLEPKLASYPAHSDVFDLCRVQMLDPHYVGKLSGLPDELTANDFAPIILMRDAMWRPGLNLRQYCTGGQDPKYAN